MSLISTGANAGVNGQSSTAGNQVANTSPIGDDAFIGIAVGGFCFILCTIAVLRKQGLYCFGRQKRRELQTEQNKGVPGDTSPDNESSLLSTDTPAALFPDQSPLPSGDDAARSYSPQPPGMQLDPHPADPTLAADAALLNPGPPAYVSSLVFAPGRPAVG